MRDFVYVATPTRVVFGVGSVAKIPAEIERLGATRALVLATAEQRDQAEVVASRLGNLVVGIFDKAKQHVPIEVAEEARAEAKRLGADCAVTVGGGSTTGLGKAIALVSELPILSVPTTFAGSEMTNIWGITQGGEKKTGRDDRVRPKTVIYDPELTLTMPPLLAGTSGMNAIAHAVEARYARAINPIIAMICEEGVRAMASSLPTVVREPRNLEARSEALYGAWLCAVSFSTMGMALHHRLCHVLGGTYNLPHAETHTIILPHAMAYNRRGAPEAMAAMAKAVGAADLAEGLYDLILALKAPTALKDIGMKEADLDRAAEMAAANPPENPMPITREGLRALLDDAYHGRRPRRDGP